MLCHVCKTRINCCFCSLHPTYYPTYVSFFPPKDSCCCLHSWSTLILWSENIWLAVFLFSQRWIRLVLTNTTQEHHMFFIPSCLQNMSPELYSALRLEPGTWPMTEDMSLIGTDIQMQTRINSNILGRRSKIKVKLSHCLVVIYPGQSCCATFS